MTKSADVKTQILRFAFSLVAYQLRFAMKKPALEPTKIDRSEDFSISEDFADLSFVYHAEHSSKTIKSDTIGLALHFYLDGQATNCFLDIYDVTMTREN